ncbi:MAG TPA: hypothetical protein VFH31_06595 [Pyrinomonadaceae bacterium]|nr:hypothetical protein [Pyrinomonadaceae bacterium]
MLAMPNKPAPFGGAKIKLIVIGVLYFRSSERRGRVFTGSFYKHHTPHGVEKPILILDFGHTTRLL